MGKIDQWTPDAFRNVESELLRMQNRRKEIPGEIEQRQNSIERLKNRIKELEQMQTKLTATKIEQQKRLDYLMQHPPRRASENEQENERLRQYWQNSVNQVRQAIQNTDDQISALNSEKNELQRKIQTLETEVLQLKNEDKEIVAECKKHMSEQREVAREAENAAREHAKATEGFSKVQKITGFGANAADSGRTLGNDTTKKYQKKRELALMLAILALSIINKENAAGQSAPDGESSQTEDVMSRGYARVRTAEDRGRNEKQSTGTVSSQQQRFLKNYGEGCVTVKTDGSTDFSKVSYVGSLKYDSSVNSYDLDSYIGAKYHITAEQMEEFRQKENVVWRVEGDSVYLIPKAGEACGSSLGYTLDEWNKSDVSRGKTQTRRK